MEVKIPPSNFSGGGILRFNKLIISVLRVLFEVIGQIIEYKVQITITDNR